MEILASQEVNLVILDIMLPDVDGLELCTKIKEMNNLPIIFLSALGENAQVIDGFRAGGDDYLTKPYDIGVLIAHIEARLRNAQERKRYTNFMGLKLDALSMIAYYEGKDLLLTQKEFLLLQLLSENVSGYVSLESLYKKIWGTDSGSGRNALHATVSRLNKKLDSTHAKVKVSYFRGEGYSLEEV
jgi:DNA-binding response OmpR family regulator